MRMLSLGMAAAMCVLAGLALPAGDAGRAPPAAGEMLAVEVHRVVMVNQHPAVILKGMKEELYLVVYIDPFMAQSIQLGMLGVSIERPQTHDLIGILLTRLGAKVSQVSITELRNDTYFAMISLRVNGAVQEIDSRPSDALAIAVRSKSPVFVARPLLHDTMFPEGDPTDKIIPEGPVGPKHGA